MKKTYIVNVSSGWPMHDPNPKYRVDEPFEAEETPELAAAIASGYLRLSVDEPGMPADESSKPTEPLPTDPLSASIPVMITKAMEKDLEAAGFSGAEIAKMTPQEAHSILAGPPKKK